MSRDDPPESGDALPDETVELPKVESSLRANLPDTRGERSVHPSDAETAETLDPALARVRKLVTQAGHARYVMRGELARGGMGAVLEVFDTDLRRRLAMKVILGKGRRGAGDEREATPVQLARFLEEAQVTGQLDHPGVVPVHELGVDEEGRVYFTMRLVQGQELSKIIDEVHAGSADWSMTRALGVLLRVCEAMSYAHEKGVVHRDLKPNNVMVGRHGQVYVMDWGVARVHGREDSHDLRPHGSDEDQPSGVLTDLVEARESEGDSPLLTEDGRVIGTPNYMPPEQAEGRIADIGARSDVYSVGAMLYRLLTGSAPYARSGPRLTRQNVVEAVSAGPPEPVQALAPETPPELVAICQKAMSRAPADRYADMGGLASDLRAFLENRVVRAYATGALVEFKKWVARNSGMAGALAAVLVLALGGTIAIAVIERANAERERELGKSLDAEKQAALSAKGEADAARGRAEEDAEVARQGGLEARRTADLLFELIGSPNPDASPGRTITVEEFLARGVRQIDEQLGDDPLVQARMHRTLGRAYVSLGRYAEAEPLLLRAWQVRTELLGEDDLDVLESLDDVGILRWRQERHDEAAALHAECLAKRRALLGEDDALTLWSMNNLAMAYFGQGRWSEAGPYYEECLEKRRKVLGDDHEHTLYSINNLAHFYARRGRREEAERLYVECLERSRLVRGDDHVVTLTTLGNLASLYMDLGRYRDAEPLLQELQQRCDVNFAPNHPAQLDSLWLHFKLYSRQGRVSDAERVGRACLDGRRTLFGDDDPKTLAMIEQLGNMYVRQGRVEQAEPLFVECLEKRRSLLGDDDPLTLTALNNLGGLYAESGRYAEAEPLLLDCLERQRRVLGDDDEATLMTVRNLGELCERQERYAEAEAFFLELIDRRDALGRANDSLYRLTIDKLDAVYDDWLNRERTARGADDPAALAIQHRKATLHARSQRFESAEALYLDCLDRRIGALGGTHSDTLVSFEALATFYADQERWDEAEPLARELLVATPEGADEYTAREQLLARIVAALGG